MGLDIVGDIAAAEEPALVDMSVASVAVAVAFLPPPWPPPTAAVMFMPPTAVAPDSMAAAPFPPFPFFVVLAVVCAKTIWWRVTSSRKSARRIFDREGSRFVFGYTL